MSLKIHRLFSLLIGNIWLNRVLFYLAVIGGCSIAFLPVERGMQPDLNDKFLHTVSFFILAFLFHIAHPKLRIWAYLVVLVLLGIFIESIQSLLPYRSFEWLDWLADISGCLIYFICIFPWTKKFVSYSRS